MLVEYTGLERLSDFWRVCSSGLKGLRWECREPASRTRSFERSTRDDESGLGSGYGQRKLGLEGILGGEIDWLISLSER